MNLFKKIGRSFTAFVLSVFSGLEEKERDIRLKQRMKRSEEKHGW